MCRFTHIVILLVSFSIYSFPKNNQQTNFQKNKISRIYYDDGVVAIERFYGDDKKIDSVKTYYKNGNKNEHFYYLNGKLNGDCSQFNRAGEKIVTWTFESNHLKKRIDHKIEFHKKYPDAILFKLTYTSSTTNPLSPLFLRTQVPV